MLCNIAIHCRGAQVSRFDQDISSRCSLLVGHVDWCRRIFDGNLADAATNPPSKHSQCCGFVLNIDAYLGKPLFNLHLRVKLNLYEHFGRSLRMIHAGYWSRDSGIANVHAPSLYVHLWYA